MTQNEEQTLRDQLAELANEVGGTPSVFQFDGGLTARITIPGGETYAATLHWGDDTDLVASLRLRLRERGLLASPAHNWRLSFDDGHEVTIKATTLKQAVALAGRGQPREVKDEGEA